MEETQSHSLFSLSIDPVTKAHLSETGKWARFLAIVGFIFLGLMVIAGIYLSITFSSLEPYDSPYGVNPSGMVAAMGVGMMIFYILFAVIMFFPLLFLLRFANKIKTALAANDQELLNTSFQNLKAYFRFIGIITIIGLAFFGIGILFGMVGAIAA